MKRRYSAFFCGLFFFFILWTATYVSEAGNFILKQGMRGNEVEALQRQLKEYGYYQGAFDGVFGSSTKLAVVNFQTDNNLEPDGVVGESTRNTLRNYKEGNHTPSRGQSQSRTGIQVAALAKNFLGVPYVWGGRSPAGFDCSGFIYYVYGQVGINIPRMADGQFLQGLEVSRGNLQIGDLVFFSTYQPGPSHVGIYIGNGQFIHASSGAGSVTITPMSKPFYAERFVGARRLWR